MRTLLAVVTSVVALALAAPVSAQPVTWDLFFDGDQEVPGPGDPTGWAMGTLTIWVDDPASPVYGSISWDFTYGDLTDPATLTGLHIHTGGFGEPGPIYLDMGTATDGGPNTLIQDWGDWNWGQHTFWDKAQLQAVVDDPEGFFVNLHTEAFPAGAVRAQIPEPASLGLIGLAGLMLLRRRGVA